MNAKIEKYKEICVALHDLSTFLQMPHEDRTAEIESISLIRKLRQIIERLRRIVEDEKPNEDAEDARIYRYVDVWKLPKDVLVKVVWEFLQWYGDYETGCPAKQCKDYPCYFKKEKKQELDENLANGDLDKEPYDKYLNDMDFDDCGNGEGCWASYYVWCYLNGYDPTSGKKKDAK